MKWTSMLAIYALVWTVSAFFVLPFHGRRSSDAEEVVVAGQELGAPVGFRPMRAWVQTTLVSATIFLIFYVAFTQGWADPNVIAGRN